MRLTVSADPGSVDEGKAALQHRARRTHLDADHLPATRLGRAAEITAELVGRNFDDLRFGSVRLRHNQTRPRLFGIADHGRDRRGLVITDLANIEVQQRVDQLALTLFELSGDDHPDSRIANPGPRPGQALDRKSTRLN